MVSEVNENRKILGTNRVCGWNRMGHFLRRIDKLLDIAIDKS